MSGVVCMAGPLMQMDASITIYISIIYLEYSYDLSILIMDI